MPMKIDSETRAQYLIGLYGKRIDKRRDIALDVLIRSLVEALEQQGQTPPWTVLSDFLAEQALWQTDAENAAEALRLRHKSIVRKGHAAMVLDVYLHLRAAESGGSTSISN